MPAVVIVNRDGSLRNLAVGTWNEAELYKKAGFKSVAGFDIATTYQVPKKVLGDGVAAPTVVQVYGKTSGKANSENKYDFPPPIDTTLFFGACLLVGRDRETGEVRDIKVDLWERIYEALFGGFEDLTGGKLGAVAADLMDRILDEREADEEEKKILNDPNTQFTKSGYVKDDFIVDDEDDLLLEDDDAASLHSSEESVPSPPPRKKAAPKKRSAAAAGAATEEDGAATTTEEAAPKSSKGRTKTTKDSKPRKPKQPASRPKRGGGFVAVRVNPSANNEHEFECKEELEEEAYLTAST